MKVEANQPRDLESAQRRYRDYLQEKHMFFTRERALILEAVLARTDHFSVDELLFDMQQKGLRVSRATLYRSLAQMAEAAILSDVDFGHGHTHYESTARPVHEHLVCRSCSKVIEASSDAFLEAVQQLATAKGFEVQSHKVQIFGTCAECLKK